MSLWFSFPLFNLVSAYRPDRTKEDPKPLVLDNPLKGKPKYLLFQACRGLKIDPGVATDGPAEEIMEDKLFNHTRPHVEAVSPVDNINVGRDPSFEDIFVSFATIPTYVAYR